MRLFVCFVLAAFSLQSWARISTSLEGVYALSVSCPKPSGSGCDGETTVDRMTIFRSHSKTTDYIALSREKYGIVYYRFDVTQTSAQTATGHFEGVGRSGSRPALIHVDASDSNDIKGWLEDTVVRGRMNFTATRITPNDSQTPAATPVSKSDVTGDYTGNLGALNGRFRILEVPSDQNSSFIASFFEPKVEVGIHFSWSEFYGSEGRMNLVMGNSPDANDKKMKLYFHTSGTGGLDITGYVFSENGRWNQVQFTKN